MDECDSSPCKAEEECVNSIGSFSCQRLTSCSPGFRKNENNQCEGNKCNNYEPWKIIWYKSNICLSVQINFIKDIDECVTEAPCGLEERCVNIRGSYRCRSWHCSPGYQRNNWGQCRGELIAALYALLFDSSSFSSTKRQDTEGDGKVKSPCTLNTLSWVMLEVKIILTYCYFCHIIYLCIDLVIQNVILQMWMNVKLGNTCATPLKRSVSILSEPTDVSSSQSALKALPGIRSPSDVLVRVSYIFFATLKQ